MTYNRRNFIKKVSAASAAVPFVYLPYSPVNFSHAQDGLNISIFSKHLQFLDIKMAAEISAELGFDGMDLTVRPKGHILPENASSDLPKAIEEINQAGSSCQMITTAITDAQQEYDRDIISTAGESGVGFYRANWFSYLDDKPMAESLEIYQHRIEKLSKLNKKHGIVGCYQNHAGTKVGASFWEIQKILEKADQDYFGTQYDIRHAVADGGFSWKNGLKLLHTQIKTIVLKDFRWGKENGVWKAVNVPIGEGMVDFPTYFKLLKSYGLNPPASLHLEYPLGGAEKGKYAIAVDQKVVFDAMKKDLQAVRKLWANA